jgi:hypothetical protein
MKIKRHQRIKAASAWMSEHRNGAEIMAAKENVKIMKK